jgi:hypothetical protein
MKDFRTRCLFLDPHERDSLQDLGLNVRMILKLAVENYGGRPWPGFVLLRMGGSGALRKFGFKSLVIFLTRCEMFSCQQGLCCMEFVTLEKFTNNSNQREISGQ